MSQAIQRDVWPVIERFLRGEGLDLSVDTLVVDRAAQRPSALCYIEYADRLLMLQRNKPPFEGHWTAPGGKLQDGEDPRNAIRREVMEETGLTLRRPRLRLIASETGPEHYNWLLFFFCARPVVKGVSKGLLTGTRPSDEGRLEWLPARDLARQALPEVERLLLPFIFPESKDDPPYFARIHFDDRHEVAELDVRPLA